MEKIRHFRLKSKKTVPGIRKTVFQLLIIGKNQEIFIIQSYVSAVLP
jgi:hypothetical protein